VNQLGSGPRDTRGELPRRIFSFVHG
jgi:hypothetical protein